MQLPRYFFENEFTVFEQDIIDQGAIQVNFMPGEYLSAPLELMEKCYYIKSGLAKLCILNDVGNVNSIMLFGPGEINPCVCGTYAFTLERYITVQAMTHVITFALSSEKVNYLMTKDYRFSAAVVEHYCRIANLMMVKDMLSNGVDSQSRVCNFLYLFSLNNPSPGKYIKLTQDDIASFVGLSRIQVARILGRLRAEEIIETRREMLRIIDLLKLKSKCSSIIEE